MFDDTSTLMLATLALATLSFVAMRCWRDWIELKRDELAQAKDSIDTPGIRSKIEVADLKARVRRLEAIAARMDR